MDAQRKRELKQEANQARPPMGVIHYTCTATGQMFLAATRNADAAFNSIGFQLEMGSYICRPMQDLWNAHGEEGFAWGMLQELPYPEDAEPGADFTEDLKALRDLCMAEHPGAKLIYTRVS